MKSQSGRELLRAGAALVVFFSPANFGLLVRHQHGIHHMDDAIRLIDVCDCDRRSAAFFVAHDDVLIAPMELSVPSYGALALQHNLATSYTIDVNPAFSPLLEGRKKFLTSKRYS